VSNQNISIEDPQTTCFNTNQSNKGRIIGQKKSKEQSELYIHIQKSIDPNLPVVALLQELRTFLPCFR